MTSKNQTDHLAFLKIFLVLSVPAICCEFVILLTNNINTAILGELNDKAITASGIANQAFDLYSIFILGLTSAFHIYIAQYYGGHNKEKCNIVFQAGLFFVGMIAIFCILVFLLFSKAFCSFFLTESETLSYAIPYLRIYSLSFFPFSINYYIQGILAMIGKAKITMCSSIIGSTINLLFCRFLVNGTSFLFSLQANGVAVSLLIGRIVESIFLIRYLLKNSNSFVFSFPNFFSSQNEIRKVIHTASPLIANECVYSFAMTMIFRNYSYTNEKYLPCIPVVNLISNLIYCPAKGSRAALGVLVGGELGRGNIDVARENQKKIERSCYFIGLIGFIIVAVLSDWIPVFFSLHGELFLMAKKMLRAKALINLFDSGKQIIIISTLRIGGDSRNVFLYDAAFVFVIVMSVSMIASRVFHISFFALYLVVESCTILKVMLGKYLLAKENWLKQLS